MKIDGKLLKEYLVYRNMLNREECNIVNITSYKIVYRVEKTLSIDCDWEDDGEIFSDTINIHYDTYISFLLRKRNEKINKILENVHV